MSRLLSSLPVGAKVRDTGTTYNGLPLDGIILEHGHDGSGITSLMSEKIITLKCFDAIEANNSDSNRKSYGNNRYKVSNLFQWLNKDAAAGNWYVAQHTADAPPTNGNVYSNYNEYDQEKGFLANFSADMKAALQTVSKVTVKPSVDGGGTESVSGKIHLLSTTEVGLANEGGTAEGTIYAYFSGSNNTNARRVAYPTQQAVSKSEYTNSSLNVNSGWYWWLRTPYASTSRSARGVTVAGSLGSSYACSGDCGVRPAWFLSSSILVSDNPNADGAYEIQFNAAPTISTPSQSLGDKNKAFDVPFTVSDADADTCTATAKIDGTTVQTWNPVTRDVEQTFSVTSQKLSSLSLGAHTIQLSATDSAGNTTSVNITFNRVVMAPVITTPSTNIGNQNKHFTITFTVTDDDSDTASAVVKIDGTDTIATLNNITLGATQSVEITSAKLATLSLGAHTIDITAQDPQGNTATPVAIHFNRIVTAPVIEIENPDVGEKNQAFTVRFKVTDDDSDSATAVVKIDNNITIATFNPVVLDHWTEVTVTNQQLVALSVGPHTINIVAEDPDHNQDTAAIAFSRAASTVIISGTDDDLGPIWVKPTITYQVSDTAGQTLTQIVESINNTTVRTINNPTPNTDYDFDLTSWANLPDETSYICKIHAENAIGMIAERTHTFRKLYDRLIVESETQQTDEAAFNVCVNALFDGGAIEVEACNNGYDASPTWEDMTQEFLQGSAHTFENDTKTATYWGVKIRITILKGEQERVYLNSYGFSFN